MSHVGFWWCHYVRKQLCLEPEPHKIIELLVIVMDILRETASTPISPNNLSLWSGSPLLWFEQRKGAATGLGCKGASNADSISCKGLGLIIFLKMETCKIQDMLKTISKLMSIQQNTMQSSKRASSASSSVSSMLS